MIRVPAKGPERAKIMLVGEAPGADEEKQGEPFVGTAGQLLRKALMSVGINPDDCYLTNICKYRPPGNDIRLFFDDDGVPNLQVIEGMEELQADILRIKPNVIVALGNYPLWALTRKAVWKKVERAHGPKIWTYTGIGNWRGSRLDSTLARPFKVIPTYHPSYINREGYSDHGTFLVDLDRVARESGFPEVRKPVKEIIVNPQGIERDRVFDRLMTPSIPDYVADFLGHKNIITTDIEYTGNTLHCVGFTNQRDLAVVVPTRSRSDLEFVRRIYSAGQPLAAQNSMFDCSIVEWHYGIEMFKYLSYDTMLAAHAINIELPKGQDYLTSVYTDQEYYKDMVDWNKVKKGEQSLDVLYDYNSKDVWTQHEVLEEQIKNDFLDPMDPESGAEAARIFRFEMALVQPLWDISRRGIRIDHEKRAKLVLQLQQEADGLNDILNELIGYKINVKSSQQVGKLLYEDLNLPVINRNPPTEKSSVGSPKTDDKTLAALAPRCADARQEIPLELIRKVRNRRDLLSKFAEVEMDEDGRCRGMYNPGGTDTGRLASKKFYPTGLGLQQQNIPRDKRARSLFIPDKEMVFGYADLERAESLVVAYLSGDPEMLRVHGPGMDAHSELAAFLFSKKLEDVTEDERYIGKQTRHAGNYMEGPKTMMVNVNQKANITGVTVTLAECKKYLDGYKDLHIFLRHWWKEVESELWATRTLYNLLGRRRIFYGHIGAIVPAAVAYIPQSTVGDTLNVGLLNIEGIATEYMQGLDLWPQYKEWSEELHSYGYQSLLQVHDAVGFQVWERDVDRALPLISKLLTIPLTVTKTLETFAIPVEIKVGESWGQVSHLQEWMKRRAEANGAETPLLLA